jgi:putative endonuclease
MKFFVYILQSELNNSFYIGQTSNVDERIKYHNKGYNRSTKAKRPWKIIYKEECSSRSEAMILERKLKSWKKRDTVLKYINSK